MLIRRPAPRPLDVIALEVVLTLAAAIQVGMLLWLTFGTWDERGISGGPVIGVLAAVAGAVGVGWLLWVLGVTGWLLAGASAVTGVQLGFLAVLAWSGEAVGISGLALAIGMACAVIGVGCGVFLPAPSARRYASEPRVRMAAGGPEPTAPRLSPPVARAAHRAGPAVVGVTAAASAAAAGAAHRAARARESARETRAARAAARADAKAAEAAERETAAVAAAEAPAVLQPKPGTPIRTSGPTQPSDPPDPGMSGGAAGSAALDDPGAIARRGRASIDAQLASPGFRITDTPPRGRPAGQTADAAPSVDPEEGA